jgi:hypothetical protein
MHYTDAQTLTKLDALFGKDPMGKSPLEKGPGFIAVESIQVGD